MRDPGGTFCHVGDFVLGWFDVSSASLELGILASELVKDLAVRGDLGTILNISDTHTWFRRGDDWRNTSATKAWRDPMVGDESLEV